jgi:nickel/cobalt transporter (NiCoT) family protein
MGDRLAGTGAPASSWRLSTGEKVLGVVLYAGIGVATLTGFLLAFRYLPHAPPSTASHSYLLFTGLGLTAYILGLRHGFDADHIAAIDNTTRKLLNDGQKPLTVGTWFSLGHSTIVFGLVVALVLATEFVESHVAAFAAVGAVVGTLISGAFLALLGVINLVIVVEVYRLFVALRRGHLDEARLEQQLQQRGFLYRYFGRLFRVIERPVEIYPIGVLFGLGFDTATEVTLIALSVTIGVSGAIPLWSVLALPLLFTCGMVLSDTTDGLAMRYAYGWAFLHPIRKVYYNLTLTVISVLVAFAIGGVELLQVLSTELGWSGAFWGWLDRLNFEQLGLGIVVLFVAAWGVAMAIYRWQRLEDPAPERDPTAGPRPSR